MAEQSIDFAGAITELISVLHRLAVAQAVPEAIDNSEGDRDRLLAIARALTAEDLQLYYQMALHGRRDLPLAVDARSGFEMTLLRMLSFRPDTTAPVGGSGVLPARVAVAAPAVPPAIPATSEPPVQQLADVTPDECLVPAPCEPADHPQTRLIAGDWSAEAWAQWVERSGLTGAPLNLARHTYLHQQGDTAWELRLSPQHQMLAGGQAFPPLQQALARDFPAQAIHLALAEPEVETPVQRRQRLAAARREAAEAALRNDPVVKALEGTFSAKLLPESLTLTH
jgi:DNA polymerase-3 subunit gamma/tau